MKKLLILGCGWLGTAVAKAAHSQFEQITGTRTQKSGLEELQQLGINNTLFSLGDRLPAVATTATALVIAIPPSKITNYTERLTDLASQLNELPQHVQLVFVSSTGYYPTTGNFNENTSFTDSPASPRVYAAEQIISQQVALPTTILRMGGLFNTTDRHPGTWFQSKNQVVDGYANMVHQNDAANSVLFALQHQHSGIFNVVCPHPMKKSDFYLAAFRHIQRQAIPNFISGKPGKWVDGSLWQTQGFPFVFSKASDAFTA